MKQPVAPCLDCPRRTRYCHRKCRKYQKYVKDAEAWREYIAQQHIPDEYWTEHAIRMIEYRRKR